MQNVFIIDHRPILRFGIRYLLERSFKDFNLIDFNSVHDLGPGVQAKMPELIFLGVNADLEQLQYMSELKAMYGNTKLIIYDPEGKAEEGIKFLRSGANGYLSKGSDLEMLDNCIQTVMGGKFYIDPLDLYSLVEGLVHGNLPPRRNNYGQRGSLTSRQNEIARLLAQGMGTSKIAKMLGLKSSTVSTMKATIYGKLKVDSVIGIKEAIS